MPAPVIAAPIPITYTPPPTVAPTAMTTAALTAVLVVPMASVPYVLPACSDTVDTPCVGYSLSTLSMQGTYNWTKDCQSRLCAGWFREGHMQ